MGTQRTFLQEGILEGVGGHLKGRPQEGGTQVCAL